MHTVTHTRKMVVIPLVVMLLLTLLAGGTAFQLTRAWETTTHRVISRASEAFILKNVHWQLRGLREDLKDNPAQAQATWSEIQRTLAFLDSFHPSSALTQSLNRPNLPEPAYVDALLAKTSAAPSLQEIQNELQTVQERSEFITGLVTASMLLLGLLLITVTARDLTRLFGELARSRDFAITLQEEERRRIAQDLHDGVVQELVDLKRNYSPDKVEPLIENIRRVCHNLKPQILEDLGLSASLEFLADDLRQHNGTTVRLQMENEDQQLEQLLKPYELTLFRIIQEIFSNIKHHAQASQVQMVLTYQPRESPVLRCYVRDNGQGFDPAQVRKGMGLSGIHERISQLGGRLEINTQPGKGTGLQFSIPIRSVKPQGKPHAG